MSQRNRIVFAASCLAAVLLLAAPAPSHAASRAFREEGLASAKALERVWSWLAQLWPGGHSRETIEAWEKEGGASNPNGAPLSVPTMPPVTVTSEGKK